MTPHDPRSVLTTSAPDGPARARSRPPRFLSVDVEVLEPGQALRFGLYVATPSAVRVLILDGEERFTEVFKGRLTEARAQVFVLWLARERYYAHLES